MSAGTFIIKTDVLPKFQAGEVPSIYTLGGGLTTRSLNLGMDVRLSYLDKAAAETKFLDQAMIASLLAAISYKEYSPIREELAEEKPSWFNLVSNNKNFFTKNKIDSFFRKKLFYNLKSLKVASVNLISLGLTEKGRAFSNDKLSLPDIEFTANAEGEYTAQGKLGAAWVGAMPDVDNPGKNKLIISFRGTEFSNLKSYLFGAYANMSGHYTQFRPLTAALIEYASNPTNNISGVIATGHSLGGAMVQEFLRDYPEGAEGNNQVHIEGYTFGSPGSVKKGIYRFLAVGVKLTEKLLARGAQPTVNILSSIINTGNLFFNSKKLRYFGLMVNSMTDRLRYKPSLKDSPEKDERLKEFYHYADAVPKLGELGYRRFGNRYRIFHESYEQPNDRRDSNFLSLENFSINKHAMHSYYNILESALFKRADILNIGLHSPMTVGEDYAGLTAVKTSIHGFNMESLVEQRINKWNSPNNRKNKPQKLPGADEDGAISKDMEGINAKQSINEEITGANVVQGADENKAKKINNKIKMLREQRWRGLISNK